MSADENTPAPIHPEHMTGVPVGSLRASCSCGWQGPDRQDRTSAGIDAALHAGGKA